MIEQAHPRTRAYQKILLRAVIALPLISAGCNHQDVPSGQTVATVNDGQVTTSDLQIEMANVPPAQRKQAQSLVVKTLVDRKILAQYAKSQGMDHNPEFVLQLRRTTELMLAERAAQQITASARQPISISEVNQYLDTHPDVAANRRVLTLDQVTFPMPNASVATELKPSKTIDDVIVTLRRRNIRYTRNQTQVDTAGLPDDLNSKLNALQPGEPLIVLNTPNSTANVIAESKPMPLNGVAAVDAARQRITIERSSDALQQRGLALRKQAKISYAKDYAPPATKGKPE